MTETQAREQILTAAVKLLNEKGFASLSMNDIVHESGVSKGGVYWHFKSKDEIIHALFDFFLETQLTIVTDALQQPGTASEMLRRVFHLGANEVDTLPPPLEFYALAARSETLRQRMSAYFEAYRGQIARILQQGIDAGEFAPCDVQLTSINIISLMEGLVLLGVSIPMHQHFVTQLDQAVELLLHGLLKR